jgi:hypothetical protein
MVPASIAAQMLSAKMEELDKFRRTGSGKEVIEPTRKEGYRSHYYSLEDVVRLAIAWRCREFIGPSLREHLWNAIPREKIVEAFDRPEGEILYLLVTATGNSKEPVRVRFQDHQPDMSIVVEDPEIVFNLTAIVRGLWRLIENADALGLVKDFSPRQPVRVVKR